MVAMKELVRRTLAALWIPAEQAVASQRGRHALAACRRVGPGCSVGSLLELVNPGRIEIGSDTTFGELTRLMAVVDYFGHSYDSRISIGSRCFFAHMDAVISSFSITIGDDVTVGSRVTILDQDHGVDLPGNVMPQPLVGAPVTIGEACWLGEGAFIGKGVTLGTGCVVGANAVVTKSFPAGAVVGGNPARLIRFRKGYEAHP